METPLVSVRVLTYNHEKYIRQCLEGIFSQKTNFPFEVIIGEDCSTDSTLQICKEYKEKYPKCVNLLTYDKNVGPQENGRRTRAVCRGKYMALCEGDDYWIDCYKLQKQVDYLESNPSTAICFHRTNVVDENSNIVKSVEELPAPIVYKWQEVFHIHIPPLSVVYRNVPLNYPDNINDFFNGDALLFAMLSTYGGAVNLGFVGACYRRHSGGIYSRNKIIRNQLLSIATRRLMLKSTSFNEAQRQEIKVAIENRKAKYIKMHLRSMHFINAIKVLLS